MNTQMLDMLTLLSLQDREATFRRQEAYERFTKELVVVRKAVDEMTLAQVLELALPTDSRPGVRELVVHYKQFDYPYKTGLALLQDVRDPTFGVPVFLAKRDRQSRYPYMNVKLFKHEYLSPVSQDNCSTSWEQIDRQFDVATVPLWVEHTNDMDSYLAYYRLLLPLVQSMGVTRLYLEPPKYQEWKTRMAQFAFNQVRAELNVDCALVEIYDPQFCQFVDGRLVHRPEAPILLQFFS